MSKVKLLLKLEFVMLRKIAFHAGLKVVQVGDGKYSFVGVDMPPMNDKEAREYIDNFEGIYYTNESDWTVVQELAKAKRMTVEQYRHGDYKEPMYRFLWVNRDIVESHPMNFDMAVEYIREHPNH